MKATLGDDITETGNHLRVSSAAMTSSNQSGLNTTGSIDELAVVINRVALIKYQIHQQTHERCIKNLSFQVTHQKIMTNHALIV